MDLLAAEWIEARAVARSYAQQRLPVLSEDTNALVRGLMDRLTALRLPDTPAELQERRWQFQGFIAMVGAVTYANRVRPARRSEWLDVTRRIQEFCDEPFPVDREGMQRLREVFSSWYGDVESILRSRDPRSETSGAWIQVDQSV
jgi:hypothetical protein